MRMRLADPETAEIADPMLSMTTPHTAVATIPVSDGLPRLRGIATPGQPIHHALQSR